MKLAVVCVLAVSFVTCCQGAPQPKENFAFNLDKESSDFKLFNKPVQWSDCTKPSDHGKINSVVITPNPPVKGQDAEVRANLTTNEMITGGTVILTGVYNNFIPYHNTFEFCDLVKDAGYSCPIHKGVVVVSIKQKVPNDVPSGEISGKAVAKDQNGERVLCVTVKYNIP